MGASTSSGFNNLGDEPVTDSELNTSKKRDYASTRANIAQAVMQGLIFLAFVVLGSVFLGYLLTNKITVNSHVTIARTAVTLRVLEQNDTYSDCGGDCYAFGAVQAFNGILYNYADQSVVVGQAYGHCINSLIDGGGNATQYCVQQYTFSGAASGFPAGTMQAAGTFFFPVDGVSYISPTVWAITGGTGAYSLAQGQVSFATLAGATGYDTTLSASWTP